jgi:peptidoglycan/LPS O-acetylase OafA/YrhL
MWHMMFLTLSANFLRGREVEQYIASIAWMVVMSSALTFLMSHLSYRWLEMPFLRLKDRFATVPFAGSKKL